MNTRIFRWKPNLGENHRCHCLSLQYFIINKTSYNLVLAQTHTSMQEPTYRRLQPSLVYQPLLEGSYNPLLLFTSFSWKGATTPLLKASTLSSTADHVSLIFKLDQTASI